MFRRQECQELCPNNYEVRFKLLAVEENLAGSFWDTR